MIAEDETVLWRVPATGNFGIRTRSKTAHALAYGRSLTVCGKRAGRYRYQPTAEDRLCRSCCCRLGEHAWIGEDPEHCMDCGKVR